MWKAPENGSLTMNRSPKVESLRVLCSARSLMEEGPQRKCQWSDQVIFPKGERDR